MNTTLLSLIAFGFLSAIALDTWKARKGRKPSETVQYPDLKSIEGLFFQHIHGDAVYCLDNGVVMHVLKDFGKCMPTQSLTPQLFLKYIHSGCYAQITDIKTLRKVKEAIYKTNRSTWTAVKADGTVDIAKLKAISIPLSRPAHNGLVRGILGETTKPADSEQKEVSPVDRALNTALKSAVEQNNEFLKNILLNSDAQRVYSPSATGDVRLPSEETFYLHSEYIYWRDGDHVWVMYKSTLANPAFPLLTVKDFEYLCNAGCLQVADEFKLIETKTGLRPVKIKSELGTFESPTSSRPVKKTSPIVYAVADPTKEPGPRGTPLRWVDENKVWCSWDTDLNRVAASIFPQEEFDKIKETLRPAPEYTIINGKPVKLAVHSFHGILYWEQGDNVYFRRADESRATRTRSVAQPTWLKAQPLNPLYGLVHDEHKVLYPVELAKLRNQKVPSAT